MGDDWKHAALRRNLCKALEPVIGKSLEECTDDALIGYVELITANWYVIQEWADFRETQKKGKG